MQQIEFNIFFIYKSVAKNIKAMAFILALVAIASTVVSFILKTKYESKVVFYPYSAESSDPRLMMYDEAQFGVFGYSDQVERYMNLGKSRSIKLDLAKKYNLYKRYGINDDTSNKFADFEIEEKLYSAIKFKKGEHASIILTVWDFDRDTAALMANDIVFKIDSLSRQQIIQRNIHLYKVYEAQFNEFAKYVTQLKDSLQYYSGKKKSEAKILALKAQLEPALDEYSKLKTKYELSKSLKENGLNTIYVVERGQAPYRKVFPNRKLIIGGSVVVSFVLLVIGFSTAEYVRANKKKFKLDK